MPNNQKIVWGVSLVLIVFILLFVWRFVQMTNGKLGEKAEPVNTTTVYDFIELKSQENFQLSGQPILTGSGFEPGWSLKLNLVGTKFGLELISQYGEAKYVGYIDLISQSTSTKVWGGFVLDKNNVKQTLGIKVDTKKCTEPSGEVVDYTIKVLVGALDNLIEDLNGCAKLGI